MSRVRLVRVTVQPEFVIDDGENLTPLPVAPLVVPAAEWPTFAAGRFAEGVAELQAELDGQADEPAPS